MPMGPKGEVMEAKEREYIRTVLLQSEGFRDDVDHAFDWLIELCHRTSRSSGFWTDQELIKNSIATHYNFWERQRLTDAFDTIWKLSRLALVHSEVSEALEEARKIDSDAKIMAELADVIIRIFDFAASLNGNLASEVLDKMVINIDREPMHGKKA